MPNEAPPQTDESCCVSEDSVGRPKYEHGKHVRDMDRIERLSVARTGGPPTEPNVNLPHSVAEILDNHVTFQLESLDRMYLNIYVPSLQYEGGVVKFFRSHRGQPFTSSSSALMSPMTKSYVAATERFAEEHQIPLIPFEKGLGLAVRSAGLLSRAGS
jgi:hypothetical protein